MPVRWLFAAVLLLPGSQLPLSFAEEGPKAEWIWCANQRNLKQTVVFRKSFQLDQHVTSAFLQVIGESARLDLALDGKPVVELDYYDPLYRIDLTDRIGPGRHTLTIHSTSCAGPSGVLLQLDLTLADGSRRSVVTDASWRVPGEGAEESTAVSFGEASNRFMIPLSRQPGISSTDNYEQWRQALNSEDGADPPSFVLMPGFEIELIRAAKSDEDSWVSLAFDPEGRAVIAKEQRGLLRMELSSDGKSVTHVASINDDLEECRGLLFAFGDLFVNANNSKGLYRLRGDGSGNLNAPQLIHFSSGGVGHGRNDLALGPDGRIYVIHGDSVTLPAEAVDWTSPFREARRGQATSEGHLLRIDPNGDQVELLAAGLRNPFGIDFNKDGEIFTYDADAEYDMGAPWYRPTRVNHLVVGGDFGWRGVTASWPPYYPDHPDNAPFNFDVGKGSPTAVKFGTRSHFPPLFREALFVLDWAYGRILAIHVEPRGSSYLLTGETFLKGRPLNVTDLDFAPDGSMYIVTGGRGTQSALYRIRHVGAPHPAEATLTAQQRARHAFGSESRVIRRRLEARLQQQIEPLSLQEVWPFLGDADPWLRHAARNVLERQPIDTWQSLALAERDRTTALSALVALARSRQLDTVPQIIRRLNELDLADAPRSERVTAFYCYWLCLRHDSELDPQLAEAVATRLDERYPDRAYEANRWLSELLVKLRPRTAVNKTVSLMEDTASQVEQMHYLFVLRDAIEGWTIELRRAFFSALSQSDQFLGGAGMPDFLARIRQAALATLDEPERQALGALLASTPTQLVPTASAAREFVNKWSLDALADSLPEVGRAERDLRRGESVFVSASCAACHRMGGRGVLIGPDLTSVSRRFGRRDLLQAILQPSRVVPEKYRSLQIVTRDGKSYVGQPAPGGDYRSPVLRLATNPLNPAEVTEIQKTDIEYQNYSAVSWMPDGLLDTFQRDEILDLLAFLESEG